MNFKLFQRAPRRLGLASFLPAKTTAYRSGIFQADNPRGWQIHVYPLNIDGRLQSEVAGQNSK